MAGPSDRSLDVPPVIVLVGPPAAGKSTVAAAVARSFGFDPEAVVSTDALRRELTGSEADTSRDHRVFSLARQRVAARLEAGAGVVVDATSLWPRRRRSWLALARAAGRRVIAVRVDAPLGTLLARNAARDRQVPPGGVVEMKRQMDAGAGTGQLVAEGFDAVVDLSTAG